MEDKGWYNGYNWNERYAKFKELKRRIARGESFAAKPPCQLCGDPEPKSVEHHDEDYSKEYIWSAPALYVLCRNCHRTQLHKRFFRPHAWQAFVAHILRGGYARDLSIPAIKKEVKAYELALAQAKEPSPLQEIPGRVTPRTPTWFQSLTLDPAQVTPNGIRPRP